VIVRYEIQKHELSVGRFPFSPVLQTKFDTNTGAYQAFKGMLCKYFREHLDKSSSIEEINAEIYTMVAEIQVKYPDAFEPVGYYTKKMLAFLYQEGRLTYEGNKVYPIEVLGKDLELLRVAQERKAANALEAEQQEIERYKEACLYNETREKTAEILKVGDKFKSWVELFEAFKDVIPKNCNLLARKAIVREHVVLEYSKACWLVTEVLIDGVGKKYGMSRWDARDV